jgi:sulfate adenylyltransferase subunit 2
VAPDRTSPLRIQYGQWDPKNQRPELWNLYNARVHPGESIRVFPLSNWTELDVWQYIYVEKIPVNPLYYARDREVVVRGGQTIVLDGLFDRGQPYGPRPEETIETVWCRFRSLGCVPCSGAVRSSASPGSRRRTRRRNGHCWRSIRQHCRSRLGAIAHTIQS